MMDPPSLEDGEFQAAILESIVVMNHELPEQQHSEEDGHQQHVYQVGDTVAAGDIRPQPDQASTSDDANDDDNDDDDDDDNNDDDNDDDDDDDDGGCPENYAMDSTPSLEDSQAQAAILESIAMMNLELPGQHREDDGHQSPAMSEHGHHAESSSDEDDDGANNIAITASPLAALLRQRRRGMNRLV